MYFVNVAKNRCKSVCRHNSKLTHKKMSKLFCVTASLLTTVWLNVTEMSILKKFMLSLQQEKMMNLGYYEKFLSSIQKKYYYGGVSKSKFSFCWHFQTDKKSIM